MSIIRWRRFHRQEGGPVRAYKVVSRIKDSSLFRPVYYDTFTVGEDVHDFLYAVGSTSTAENAIGMFVFRNVKEAKLWGNRHCDEDWAILEVSIHRVDVLRTVEDWVAPGYGEKKTYFPVMTTKALKVKHIVEDVT